MTEQTGKVAIIIGSDSDLPIIKAATDFLAKMAITYEIHIMSAHRSPHATAAFAAAAKAAGFEAIIAAAGMAAHLPGVIAAETTLPVIGVPIKSGALAGVDALYAIVQMPPGIPVATVGIDAAKNAAVLAAQILAIKYPALSDKLESFKAELAKEVAQKDQKLQAIGINEYLNQKK